MAQFPLLRQGATMVSALPRRSFLAQLGTTVSALSLGPGLAETTTKTSPILAFSKPFRSLSFDDAAELCAEVGWDGLEVPLRAQGSHIEPARAGDDLPKFIEALRRRGKSLAILTTDITRVTPAAEQLLRLAAKLGVRLYRLGFQYYAKDRSVPAQLAEIGAQLRDLAALNRELGIQGGFQNHSGPSNVGAPIWDLWTMLKDLDPRHLGVCFDIAHATIEGGLSWPTEVRLMRPHWAAVFVKDFNWEKTERGGRVKWCPLGEGMISPTFFRELVNAGYQGPLCQHHEYDGLGEGQQRIQFLRKDLRTLREWLKS